MGKNKFLMLFFISSLCTSCKKNDSGNDQSGSSVASSEIGEFGSSGQAHGQEKEKIPLTYKPNEESSQAISEWLKDFDTLHYLKKLLTYLNDIKLEDHSASAIESYENKIVEKALRFTGKYQRDDALIVNKTISEYSIYLKNLQDYKKLGAILVIARESGQDLEEGLGLRLELDPNSPISNENLLSEDKRNREFRLRGLFEFIEKFKPVEAGHELREFLKLTPSNIKIIKDPYIGFILKKIQKQIRNNLKSSPCI